MHNIKIFTGQMEEKKTFGIIGGGLMGMSLATQLTNEGYRVTILERSSELGGLTTAWDYGGYIWDKFYHVILPDDTNTLELINYLGLQDELNWQETKTGFFIRGNYHSMSNLIEFIKFPELNLIDKFRLGLTILAGSFASDYERLEAIPVDKWLIKWSGRKTFEKIWKPLLKAKLGEEYKHTSAAFICATIKRLYGARKKGNKKEIFGYVNGGYAKILNKYTEKLNEENIRVKTQFKVSDIVKTPKGQLEVKSESSEKIIFDFIISTLPSFFTASFKKILTEKECNNLKNIKYLGVVCVSLLIKEQLTDYYVTNITDPKIPLTGVIEMTAIVNRDHFGGNSLVYLPKYTNPSDHLFDMPDEEIIEKFIDDFKAMQPNLKQQDILVKKVAKARFVITIPVMGYSTNLPSYKTSIDNFFIINSSFITDGTLNVNETLKVAKKYFVEVLKEIQ
jgi:protoporphyrinogen oxidase